MPDATATPEGFLPLTPAVMHILLALADGEKHGYGIMQEVEALTDGAMQLGPGTLYGTIKRLLAAGLLQESDDRPDPALDDQQRRYYRLTGLGQRVLELETERLAALLAEARRMEVWVGT
jgi:DNA-binding PadR family transcriptional regulator